jgi:hypothetical protein
VRIKEEPLILSLETTTRAGSICPTRGERQLAACTGEGRTKHSNDLLKNIQAVLESAGYDIKDVDAFAVALGPGSALEESASGEALNLRTIYVRPSDAELKLQCLEQNQPAG